jgi:hypothetical protein
MMTGPGTNTYLFGVSEIAVIDPGPEIEAHIDAIIEAAGAPVRGRRPNTGRRTGRSARLGCSATAIRW